MRHGGKILIDQLEAQGTTTAFTVPGESFLAALDGLHDSNRIKTVICRQEGGASMMADAWGKITGEPGVCFVTRGPGAANAMSGLHVAQQDSTPLVMFVGMPARDTEDRDAFQEIDVKRLFSSFVKWAGVIRHTERIPEYVSHAFHAARSGRPGPVVLGLPEDMLSAECEAIDAKPARIAAGGSHGGRHGGARRQARQGIAPADDRRRAGLERRRAEGRAGLCRALRSARRDVVPLPGLRRQPPSLQRRLRRVSASMPSSPPPSRARTC